MKKISTLMFAFATALAANAQTDATYKIVNPSFEQNGTEGWTVTDMKTQTNTSFTKKHGNVYLEKWVGKGSAVGSASVKQTVKNLPKGTYRLTVAAHNIQQDTPNAAQTGANIYGRSTTNKAVVTTPNDYSVEFTITTSSAAIGFTATNATGNYICCDNFRLTYLSTDAAQLASLITDVQTQQTKKMNDVSSAALAGALANLQNAIDAGTEDLTALALKMTDALADAEANTKAYSTMKSQIAKAKLLLSKKMSTECLEALNKAYEEANIAMETTDNDPVALNDALVAAYDNAQASITAYTNLNNTVTNAASYLDDSKIGAEAFAKTYNAAKDMFDNASGSTAEVEQQIADLKQAIFILQLANATPGTGIAPSVTETYTKYVPTGATEALMRATYAGDNILEKGVCWSTEHNPTVLDSRATKSFTLNGSIIHVKGLQPATVYYLRPYVMNRTYTVAYGEEVKIVTHPAGTCTWSWDEAGPDAATNDRCRTAVKQTIDYFNEWTGIKGFHLSGHYVPGAGAGGGTADCSYGGYMRISQNSANQAIGTVLHETGHGVGVGTHPRYTDEKNLHNWKWYGREANEIYSFLENKEANPYTSDFCMVGDGTHAWGSSATYDWFVNGASTDKHLELQYIGGCCLLYGLFIDGLDPNSSNWWETQHNGISGYTYNYDDRQRYYIMCKDEQRGLGTSLLYNEGNTTLAWGKEIGSEPITDDAAWYIEYDAKNSYYMFRNASTGKYMTHSTSTPSVKTTSKPTSNEYFQLMPDRTDVTIKMGNDEVTTHGYWFTWTASGFKSLAASSKTATAEYGKTATAAFDFADTATTQQWIIISENEMKAHGIAVAGIKYDIDGDKAITINDVTTIIDKYLNQNEGDKFEPVLDVNGDNSFDINDITALIDIYLAM